MKRNVLEEILRSTDTGAGKNSYLDEVCIIADEAGIATPNFTVEIFPPHEDDLRHAEVMGIMSDPTPQNAKALLAHLRSCRSMEMTEDQKKILDAALDVCSELAYFAESECPDCLLGNNEAQEAGCPCPPNADDECPDDAGSERCWRIVARYRILKRVGLS